jgi:putative restriction endonuclease
MLRDTRFLPPGWDLPAPEGWPREAVQGKGYDVAESAVEGLLRQALKATAETPDLVAGDVFGDPRLAPNRLGQRPFQALVLDVYHRRCAVTGERIVPVLQAAHIKPIGAGGENRVDNGLLLRSDVHTLFDRGYLGLHPRRYELLVSPALRREWDNGEEFYTRAGDVVDLPERRVNRPNREFLTWHVDTVFRAS